MSPAEEGLDVVLVDFDDFDADFLWEGGREEAEGGEEIILSIRPYSVLACTVR